MAWREYWNEASSVFLWNNIHETIKEEYSNKNKESLAQKLQQEALRLQNYLQQIKYYIKYLENIGVDKKGYLDQALLELFVRVLDGIRDKNNRKLNTIFRIKEVQNSSFNYFLHDLYDIILAVLKTKIDSNLKFEDTLKLYINFGLGDIRSAPNFNFSKFKDYTNDIVDTFMKRTDEKIKLQIKKKTRKNFLGEVQQKIDVAGNKKLLNIDIFFEKNNNFDDFAKLMLSATFSAKNYANAKPVLLLPITDLRILLEILPSITPNPLADEDALASFLIALSHRMLNSSVETIPHQTNMRQVNQTIGLLSYIHRLTGRGQNYKGVEQELNDFLSLGAKYLIYNNPNNDEIYVLSTKYILSKYLNPSVRSNKTFTITKTFIKTRGDKT